MTRPWMTPAALGLIAAMAAGCPQVGEPLPEPAAKMDIEALFSDEKIYTTDFGYFYPRDDIVKFASDGALVNNYVKYRTGMSDIYIQSEGTETGRWRAQGQQFERLPDGLALCRGRGQHFHRRAGE